MEEIQLGKFYGSEGVDIKDTGPAPWLTPAQGQQGLLILYKHVF